MAKLLLGLCEIFDRIIHSAQESRRIGGTCATFLNDPHMLPGRNVWISQKLGGIFNSLRKYYPYRSDQRSCLIGPGRILKLPNFTGFPHEVSFLLVLNFPFAVGYHFFLERNCFSRLGKRPNLFRIGRIMVVRRWDPLGFVGIRWVRWDSQEIR